ncbi:MAG: hypothetical protein EOO12_08285 [Chitinophagaceae bacterium]|nr:MAG: hypothetical protein EOO12_08285 [Chitinophagaceae bacterium]
MRLPLLTLLLLAVFAAQGQLSETFADSNFTSAPTWTGTGGAWLVNPQRQLQSSFSTPNSSCYLSTPNSLCTDAEWTLWLRLAFATSSVNYTDIWVLSRDSVPETPGNTGYFIRVGGAQDDICLYRKDPAATVKLIDGPDGATGGSDNRLRLQLVRSGGTFYLRHIPDGGAPVADGQATDATYVSTRFFALLLRQSTSSFFGKHYFDDLQIAAFVRDSTPPALESMGAPNDSTVEIRFSEPIDPASAVAVNFHLAGMGAPLSAAADPSDGALLYLRFATALPADTPLLLTVLHIRDAWGNELLQDTDRLWYHPPRPHDLLITELLPDPDPPRGLPPFEFVEVYNRSAFPIALQGWRIGTATALSGPLPRLWLAPDSFLLLTSTAGAGALRGFGTALGLSAFPALDNDGSLVQLRSADGRTIHALAYDRSWYRSAVKDDGGWSLELIDPHNPCAGGDNWRASEDARGGTPGGANSVAGVHPDRDEPLLLRAYAGDSLHVVAVFSEPLDSSALRNALFSIQDGPSVQAARALAPLFRSVELQLAAPLQRGRVYTLSVSGATDCSGNPVGTSDQTPVGLAEDPIPASVAINELLYQPVTGGSEYVELLALTQTVDAARLYLATRDAAGALRTPKQLSPVPLYFYPGEYHVLTGGAEDVASRYHVARPAWLHKVAGLPALSDDGATLVLLDDRGAVLDEVPYSPRWQFALLDDTHGVALERLDATRNGADAHNWHSAAQSAGFGTPTARNSQVRGGEVEGMFTVIPAVVSPDNDGYDDVAIISYELEESGYVANLTLFDALGRPQRRLVQNALLGRSGRWTFDGLDDRGQRLAVGSYLLFAELFDLEGRRKVFKRAISIARKFN